MPELSYADVFEAAPQTSSQKELTYDQVFGGDKPTELSHAEVFGAPSTTPASDAQLQKMGVDTQAPEASFKPEEHPTAEAITTGVARAVGEMVPRSIGQAAKMFTYTPLEEIPAQAKQAYEDIRRGPVMNAQPSGPYAGFTKMPLAEQARLVAEPIIQAAPALLGLRGAIRGEPNAIERSNAQVEARGTPLGVETRPESNIPQTSDSNNVIGEAQRTGPRGNVQGGEEQGLAAPAQEAAQPIAAESISPEPAVGGVHAEALAARPIETPDVGEAVGWEEATKRGEAWLDAGGNPQSLINSFRRTGKISVADMGRMRAAMQRLEARTNVAGDALKAAPDDPVLQQGLKDAITQEQAFADAYKPMHTVASNTLRSLQGTVPLTEEMAMSPTGLERKFREVNGEQPFTPENSRRANKISEDMKQANGEYAKANGEVYKALDNEYGRIRTKRKGPPTLDDLGKTFGKLDEVCG